MGIKEHGSIRSEPADETTVKTHVTEAETSMQANILLLKNDREA